jgi:4a-hydroxytetrahydrobiopterin dehydratase
MDFTDLLTARCAPLRGDAHRLSQAALTEWLEHHAGWALDVDGNVLEKRFAFADFYKTMAFVNALAWLAHRHDHHPDASFGYNYCVVRFSTHDVGGISRNDLICASQTDALLA